MNTSPYTGGFYEAQQPGSRRSAGVVVPLVVDLLAPASVVDVGCGVGPWLAAFRACGVEDVRGVDGDWVERTMLEIPPERFLAADLARPLRLGRTFDLALSLEVAEHLPAEAAETFVDSLAALAPRIVFSAAIPGQGGTHHVNEQWPEYWAERFEARGYVVVDALRPRIWRHPDVCWYYAQNTLLFVRPEVLAGAPRLQREREATRREQLALVHPRQYEAAAAWARALVGAIEDVAAAVPAQARLVVVDDARCGPALAAGRPAVPFLERDGQYWGAPPDDRVAVEELERLRAGGAAFLVLAWPAFWWLEHYGGFHRHLRARYPCVVENDRAVIFDLRRPRTARGPSADG